MLRSMKELERYKVSATDGDLGSVDNFLVEDTSWAVRYLVMDTGGPLGGRRVLIPQLAFREVDYSARRFRLALSRTKIQESPSINLDLPVFEASRARASPVLWLCPILGHRRRPGWPP